MAINGIKIRQDLCRMLTQAEVDLEMWHMRRPCTVWLYRVASAKVVPLTFWRKLLWTL